MSFHRRCFWWVVVFTSFIILCKRVQLIKLRIRAGKELGFRVIEIELLLLCAHERRSGAFVHKLESKMLFRITLVLVKLEFTMRVVWTCKQIFSVVSSYVVIRLDLYVISHDNILLFVPDWRYTQSFVHGVLFLMLSPALLKRIVTFIPRYQRTSHWQFIRSSIRWYVLWLNNIALLFSQTVLFFSI